MARKNITDDYIKVVASRHYYGERLEDICKDLKINYRIANEWQQTVMWKEQIRKLEIYKAEFENELVQKEKETYQDSLEAFHRQSKVINKAFSEITLMLNQTVLKAVKQIQIENSGDYVRQCKEIQKTGISNLIKTATCSSTEARALAESVHSISQIQSYISKINELN
jgi:hypothetical protein